MSEGTRVDFTKENNVSWHARLPDYDTAILAVQGVEIRAVAASFQQTDVTLSIIVPTWAPRVVLTSGDADQRPKLFVRYKSSTINDQDGVLVLVYVYAFSGDDSFNQSVAVRVPDGVPEWANLAVRARSA